MFVNVSAMLFSSMFVYIYLFQCLFDSGYTVLPRDVKFDTFCHNNMVDYFFFKLLKKCYFAELLLFSTLNGELCYKWKDCITIKKDCVTLAKNVSHNM